MCRKWDWSGCSEAVEPYRIITGLGIGESERAVAGQSNGRDGLPHGIGQVRAGFHHDGRASVSPPYHPCTSFASLSPSSPAGSIPPPRFAAPTPRKEVAHYRRRSSGKTLLSSICPFLGPLRERLKLFPFSGSTELAEVLQTSCFILRFVSLWLIPPRPISGVSRRSRLNPAPLPNNRSNPCHPWPLKVPVRKHICSLVTLMLIPPWRIRAIGSFRG